MSNLERLFTEQDQSPWLDGLQRDGLRNGHLEDWIARGVRGVTSNPTTFQKAIAHSTTYDEEIAALATNGATDRGIYWTLAINDVERALDLLLPTYRSSGGEDGFVSLELAPELAYDTSGSISEARRLHRALGAPNLMVKIPGTVEGVPAIQQMVREGRNVNVTLLFSLQRYDEVMEAYLAGLEDREGDLSGVHGVASFFVSRIDAEVDRRLAAIGSDEALALRGQAAIAQARLAYAQFRRRFSGPRWSALLERGAHVQRPLWASTSTKNPGDADTKYADALIGPDTVNTMPESTLQAFDDHGRLERSIDRDLDGAQQVIGRLKALGIDLDAVGTALERDGVDRFTAAFSDLLVDIGGRAARVRSSGAPR